MKISKFSDANIETLVLLLSVMIVGLCTIIYELLIGSISSYFLGDSVKQFSITIGLTMSAMGFGTYLSRLIKENLISWFIGIEIVLGLIGGLSVPILYQAYAVSDMYYPCMLILILIIGTLIGLEIPILTRVMEKYYALKTNISNVLSLDYLGALVATLLFPFILLPFFGLFSSALITGVINIAIGILNLWWFKDKLGPNMLNKFKSGALITSILLISMLITAKPIVKAWENSVYDDRVILSKQTSYQNIVLTRNKQDFRLYLDGNLQFSSIDEYRYHEPLIHVPFSLAPVKENILVLGGGDGLAVREILKYPQVKHITLIDLDPEMIKLAKTNKAFKKLNKGSFLNPKVTIKLEDAFKFLENSSSLYDVVIADLPDPNNTALSRLYSKEFHKLINKNLSKTGIFVTQATSPFFAKESFWCVNQTAKEAGFKHIYPYHAYVPSFGDWGFVMASNIKLDPKNIDIKVPVKYLDNETAVNLFNFEKDLYVKNIKYSSLDKPEILNYYLKGWKYWN